MNDLPSQFRGSMQWNTPGPISSGFFRTKEIAIRPTSLEQIPKQRSGDKMDNREDVASAQALLMGLFASRPRMVVDSWEDQTRRVLPLLWTKIASEVTSIPAWPRPSRQSKQGPSRLFEEIQSDRARTSLGKRLWALRAAIVKSGAYLLDWNELDEELRERRGEAE